MNNLVDGAHVVLKKSDDIGLYLSATKPDVLVLNNQWIYESASIHYQWQNTLRL